MGHAKRAKRDPLRDRSGDSYASDNKYIFNQLQPTALLSNTNVVYRFL